MTVRILLKIGGQAFEGPEGYRELAEGIRANPAAEVMIVHGGGREISRALETAGRETRFVDGVRVTAAEDVAIVESVLTGGVNPRIVSMLEQFGVHARGCSGRTRNLFIVEPMLSGGRSLGFVGRIRRVNPDVVLEYLRKNIVPVVSPVSADDKGAVYNVNADSAAAALAVAAACTDLVFLTDVPGVRDAAGYCECLTIDEAERLIAEGSIQGGMVAKMRSAFEALSGGVPRVHILRWNGSRTIAEMIARRCRQGTTILCSAP
jgi:acetylglutamate kinase